MAKNEVHKDDVGTEFNLTIVDTANANLPIDLTSASIVQVIIRRSDGSKKVVEGTVFGPPTDGRVNYYTVAGDLNIIGWYKVQAIVVTPAGLWHSAIARFPVIKNI